MTLWRINGGLTVSTRHREYHGEQEDSPASLEGQRLRQTCLMDTAWQCHVINALESHCSALVAWWTRFWQARKEVRKGLQGLPVGSRWTQKGVRWACTCILCCAGPNGHGRPSLQGACHLAGERLSCFQSWSNGRAAWAGHKAGLSGGPALHGSRLPNISELPSRGKSGLCLVGKNGISSKTHFSEKNTQYYEKHG